MKKNFIFLFLLVIFCIPTLLPLIHKGFLLTDDGNWMVIRFSAFYEVFRSGEFPVRFLTRLNNGFGYPVSNFLYPLFMYLGVPIHILGFGFVNTIKIILGLSLIFSSIFTFLWLKKIFNNTAAFIGSIFYTFFPYHLYDVYKRGSVGEVLALTFLPFILWQVERRSIFFTSLGIGFLILSHNTLALLFSPVIFTYSLLRNIKSFRFISTTTVFGLGISSFFWIPAIYDTRYTVFSDTKVSDFYNYFVNLNNFELIGIASLTVLFSSLFLLNKKILKNKLFFSSVLVSFLVIFLVTPFSGFLWKISPLTNVIQFPFRLISLLMILLTYQLGFFLNSLNDYSKKFVFILFLVLIFISAKPFLSPTNYQYYPDSFYTTNMDTTTVKNEYMPKWVKGDTNLGFISTRVINLTGHEKINVLKVSPREIQFDTFLSEKRTIVVNLVYFPGWNVYINGVKDKIDYENSGLIIIDLEKGQNNVRVVFEETGIRIISDLLSIISLLGLFFLIFLINKRKINI